MRADSERLDSIHLAQQMAEMRPRTVQADSRHLPQTQPAASIAILLGIREAEWFAVVEWMDDAQSEGETCDAGFRNR